MSDSAVIWTNGLITPDPDAAGSDSGTVAGSQNNSIHTVKSHCDNTTRDGRAYDQEIGEPGQAGEYNDTLSNTICSRVGELQRERDPSSHWMDHCAELDYLEAKYSTNADNTARCVKRRQRREEKFVGENNSFIDYWENRMRTLHDKRTVKDTTPLTTPSSTSPGGLSPTCLGINYTRAERKDNVVSLSVQSGSSELQFEVSHEVFAYGTAPVKTIDDLKTVTKDTVQDMCGRMIIEGEVVLYGQQTLDSGCNAQLGQVRLNEVLTGLRNSNTVVRTAVGSDSVFPGDKHGVMNMYTLNLNPNDPEGKGSNVSHSIDTVAGLNDDLFSMSAY